MKSIIVLLVLGLVTLTTVLEARLTDNCVRCICEAEPNCEVSSGPLGPAKLCWWNCPRTCIGDNCRSSRKRGTSTDVSPACEPINAEQNPCSDKTKCTPNCIASYLAVYGSKCALRKREPTCGDYAALQNGGPEGCWRSSSLEYMKKVAKCCSSLGGCN